MFPVLIVPKPDAIEPLVKASVEVKEEFISVPPSVVSVSYTHLRAHETLRYSLLRRGLAKI